MSEKINPPGFRFGIKDRFKGEEERLSREYSIIWGLRNLEINGERDVLAIVTGSFLEKGSRLLVVSGVPLAGKSSVLREFREYIRKEIDPFLDFNREWSYEDALYAEVEARGVRLQDLSYDRKVVQNLLAPVNRRLYNGLIEELRAAGRENRENRGRMAAWLARKDYRKPEERIQIVTSEIPGIGPSWVDMGRSALHGLVAQDRKATIVIIVPDLLIMRKAIDIRMQIANAPPVDVPRILKEQGLTPVGFGEGLSEEEKGKVVKQTMIQSADEKFATFVQREMLSEYPREYFIKKEGEKIINPLYELKLPDFLNVRRMDRLRFLSNYDHALKLQKGLKMTDKEKHGESIHEIILAYNSWVSGVYFRPPNNTF